MVAAGLAGSVQAIDLQSTLPLWHAQIQGQAAGQLALSPNGEKVAVLFDDGWVRTWETATGERATRESSPLDARQLPG
ncbi:MAG: hypothetical protein CM1200mP29_05690 [Verrucomicrobiota bacterium]|nr:MAG: hypothetical protein CM1200mP29_05690 [Verrucomicrobiota bacterium]